MSRRPGVTDSSNIYFGLFSLAQCSSLTKGQVVKLNTFYKLLITSYAKIITGASLNYYTTFVCAFIEVCTRENYKLHSKRNRERGIVETAWKATSDIWPLLIG